MNDIHESGEDYLEAILCLKEENGIARSVDVARRLNVSKPSVSRAMSILEEKGYVFVGKIGSLELTEEGKKLADEIYARHVLLTRFLQKITGVSEEQAEANACKMEHDIDDDVKRGIEKWMKENS
ncbi:MAG: metal-dependent transcriptional regulator [Treponema sp.]|nr:metal-dependent transcriptional regulator [Treponema sp.]